MWTLLRIGGTIGVALGSAFLLWRFVLIPYRCNARLRDQTGIIRVVFPAARTSVRAVEIARRVAADLEACTLSCPDDIALLMVLAASYRAAGMNARAIDVYERALRYDRRPELYLNLGQAQLATGRDRAALQNLTLACIHNPAYLDDTGRFRPEVKRAVDLYQIRLGHGSSGTSPPKDD